MIKHPPKESKPASQPPKALVPLPIPDVHTHLGILRDLAHQPWWETVRDIRAHMLDYWPAFVGQHLRPACIQYAQDALQRAGNARRPPVISAVIAEELRRRISTNGGLLVVPRANHDYVWSLGHGSYATIGIRWEPGRSIWAVELWGHRSCVCSPIQTRVGEDTLQILKHWSMGLFDHDVEASR